VPKVAVIAKLTAAEGKRDELAAAIADVGMRNVAGEPGTLVYAAHKDQKDENVIWFYELYSDGDALAAHGGSDAMKEFGRATGPLLAGRPELFFLEPLAAKGIDL
jgi:quinol monooxygenase YgiN